MSSVPEQSPRAHLPPHLAALELRDFNARDVGPAQDPDAFPHASLTDAEVDALFVLEMERRDRALGKFTARFDCGRGRRQRHDCFTAKRVAVALRTDGR